MPGKHYKGMPKYKKKGMPKKDFDFKSENPKNKKNYNKLTTSQAEKVSEQATMSAVKGGMPRGIGNYKGSGNFAMKNKMLSDSAKNRIPMQTNYDGMPNKYWTAIKEAAKGSNVTTAVQRYKTSIKNQEAQNNNSKKEEKKK